MRFFVSAFFKYQVKCTVLYFLFFFGFLAQSQNFETTFLNSNPILLSAFNSGDIDNDGDLDLIYGGRKDRRIAWLENNGEGQFIKEHTISNTVGIPQTILLEDLDGDGWKDVVCTDYYSIEGSVIWKKNEGNGVFSDWIVIHPNFGSPDILAAADIDNDSDIDLVINSDNNDSIILVKNNGNGTFAPPITISDDESIIEVLLVDVDADTDIDIVFATTDDHISYFSNTSGSFSSTPTAIATGVQGVRTLNGADMNADGAMDLVFGYSHAGSITGIRWLENTAPGVYNIDHIIASNYLRTDALFIGDIDGDGDLDMYSGSDQSTGLRYHENIGSGAFETYSIGRLDDPIAVVGIDVNDNGFLDPIFMQPVGGSIGYYDYIDGEHWKYKNPIAPRYIAPVDVCISDIDSDNDMDITSISQKGSFANSTSSEKMVFGTMRVHENTLSNEFDISQWVDLNGFSEMNGAKPTQIKNIHLDNDSDIDFIGYNGINSLLFVMENHGDSGATFVRRDIDIVNSDVTGVTAVDIDSDGDRDLITVQMDSTLGVYFNTGNLTFSARTVLSTINFNLLNYSLPDLHSADINNDGVDDIILEIPDDSDISNIETELLFFENNGNSTLTLSSNTLTVATTLEELYFEHIDADNLVDLILKKDYGPSVDEITLYTNQGSFQYSSATTLFSNSINIDLKDMDGDNDLDIIGAHQSASWYENDGSGNFSTSHLISYFPSSVYNLEISAGDIDNDGDKDIVYVGTNNEVKVFENDNNTFVSDYTFPYTCRIDHLILDDISGDGTLDFIGYDGFNQLFWKKGYGSSFSELMTLYGSSNCSNVLQSIDEMDVNGDGKKDYVLSSESGILWSKKINDTTFCIPTLLIDSTSNNTTLEIIDFNGDGIKDIVAAFASPEMRNIELYQNNGNGLFLDPQDIFNTNYNLDALYAVDIEGDTDMDIIGFKENQSNTLPSVVLFSNNGVGGFDTAYVLYDDIMVYDVITNDMNIDGALDLVIASNDLLLKEQLVGGGFDTSIVLSTDRYFSLATADFNNDTNEDLIGSNGYHFKWYNYNSGAYDANDIFMPYYVYPDECEIYTSDLDGDNDMDIVTVLVEEHNVVIHTNLQNTISYITETTCDSLLSPSANEYYTASGTYYDTLSTSEGGDSIIVVDVIVFGNDSVSQEFEICDGGSITIGLSTYTQAGEYTDTLVNTCGNDSILYTTLVVLNSDTTNLNETICMGDTIQFGGQSIFSAGEYTNTMSNNTGCDSVLILAVSMFDIDTDISLDNSSNMFTVVNPITGATYQWIDCGNGNMPISGATSNTYTANQNGSYAVEISLNSCQETSPCLTVEGIDIKENVLFDLSITPNPNIGELKIDFGQSLESVNIKIWNLLGSKVYETNILSVDKEILDINHLPSGIYNIEINSNQDRVVKKIIKRNNAY